MEAYPTAAAQRAQPRVSALKLEGTCPRLSWDRRIRVPLPVLLLRGGGGVGLPAAHRTATLDVRVHDGWRDLVLGAIVAVMLAQERLKIVVVFLQDLGKRLGLHKLDHA